MTPLATVAPRRPAESPTKNLKQKTVTSIKWEVMNQIAQKVLSFGTFAVLARLMEPSVFGIMAMAFVALDGMGMFKTMGLDSGVVQKKDAPEDYHHTAFVIIQLLGVILCTLCWVLAPVAAHFFKTPQVETVLQALAIVFIFTGFGRVPSAILMHQMRFRTISLVQFIGSVVNSICAISFAIISPTVWAMIFAYLAKQIVMTALIFYYSGYKPKIRFERAYASHLFHFGKFIMGMSFIRYISMNVGPVIVGKLLGATMLGYFMLARNISNFINQHFTSVVSRVMFPAYSRLQDDPEVLRRAYLKTVKFLSIFSIPFGVTLIMLAPELVLTIYGEKWSAVIPLIRIFGIVQLVTPIAACSPPLYRGVGKPHIEFHMNLIGLLIAVPMLVGFTYFYGLIGTTYSALIGNAIMVPVHVYLTKKLIHVSVRDLLRQLGPALICTAFMVGSIFASTALLEQREFFAQEVWNHLLVLTACGGIGVLAYLTGFHLIDRKTITELRQFVINPKKAQIAGG